MTKENIKEAYGQYYSTFEDYITEDGWIGLSRYGWDEDWEMEEKWDEMMEELEFEEDHEDTMHYWRPITLKNII